MAKPLVSADTWRAIKLASIRGVPDAELAEYFGVTANAITSRRFDDPEWKAAKPKIAPNSLAKSPSNIKSNAEAIEAVTNASLAEIGEQNSLLLARYVGQKIKTAAEHDLLPEPSNWAELKTASEILRKATGQDRDQPAVAVNLFGGGQFDAQASPVFEASLVETEAPETVDFC